MYRILIKQEDKNLKMDEPKRPDGATEEMDNDNNGVAAVSVQSIEKPPSLVPLDLEADVWVKKPAKNP